MPPVFSRPNAAPPDIVQDILARPLLLLIAAATVAGPREPQPAIVPAALRARAPQLEMSGLAWSATLDRYLVVIDDSIDLEERNRHAPYVLAMGRDGKVDAQPVPILGVDELDDAEALTAGPRDTFYVLTSHAPNRHGKLSGARRQLLALKLEQRRLRVAGTVDLLHGHGDLSHQLAKVGLTEGAVDLEGLAYRDGALYIGMKAPLLPDGAAGIVRLAQLDGAFATGKLPEHSLTLWGSVRLTVPALGRAGASVDEGIADLTFAPDGALYLCANAPKGTPPDGGGALWRVAAPEGQRMAAQLVRRFADLKPEGVAVAPDGQTLTLVFDRDKRDPLWVTVPLAR